MLKLLRLSLVPLAILCVLVLRLLRGRVRIGILWTQRIGHLAGNVEVYLCERDAGIRPHSFDIWCAPGEPCNKQLLKMWGRVLHIDRTGFANIVFKLNRLFRGWQSIEIPSGNLDRDVNNLWERYAPHTGFTPKEEFLGKTGLQNMGIPDGAKWACLIVRDNAYLPQLSYHAYRDSDVDTYTEAALELARRGYYVIRMGAKVAKPMPIKHERIIDYATNGMRSDFMDIYLAAKCEFMISNGTGLDAVAGIFRRPICYVNYVPLEYLNTWNPHSLAIWKHHEKDGKRMTPAEIYESGAGKFMRSDEFEDAGIKLVDNTPEEIKAVVEEMADTFRPASIPSGDQSAFWRDFPCSLSPHTNQPLHGEIRMRIGREFLKGYATPFIGSDEKSVSSYEIPLGSHLMSYYG